MAQTAEERRARHRDYVRRLRLYARGEPPECFTVQFSQLASAQLQHEAKARGIGRGDTLARRLIETILRDGMIDAVLDGGGDD